jgi:type IV pilus assembly protein PilE
VNHLSLRFARSQAGMSLIELMVTISIVGILAAIAYPSYTQSVAKSKRRAAEACLSNMATHMERYYTSNLRYCVDADSDGACDSSSFTVPSLECSSAANTGGDYNYSITVGLSTYTLQAAPQSAQASRDARCGTLSLTQSGAKSASASDCW